jgi:hypothetical protein
VLDRRARPHEARSPSAGQAYVELILVLPIMLLLTFVVGDFGRVYASGVAVEDAAREAADYAAFDDVVTSHFTQDPATFVVDAKDSTRLEALRRACAAVSSLPDYSSVAALCADPTSRCTTTVGDFCTLLVEDTRSQAPWATTCGTAPQTDVTCGWSVHVTVRFSFHTALNVAPLPTTVDFVRDSRYPISALPASGP